MIRVVDSLRKLDYLQSHKEEGRGALFRSLPWACRSSRKDRQAD